MVEWLQAPIPGSLDLAWVAIVNGRKFAAIAKWKPANARTTKFLCVLEADRQNPTVFTQLAGAKKFVEVTATVLP